MLFKSKVLDAPAVVFRVFYLITKANGLLPISISFNPLNARCSFVNVLYSVCYTLMLLVCLSCSQTIVIGFIGILQNPKLTIIIVFVAQVTCSWLRVASIYVSQLFNHKHLANFINRSVMINEMFRKTNSQNQFLDLKLSKWCLFKLMSTILQVFLILVPSVGFIAMIKLSENFILLLIGFFIILYSHMVLILSTGIYFSGQIVIGQFYKNLNSRILILEKKIIPSNHKYNSFYSMGMQRFCNLSDELDKLTSLYRDITNHAKLFNKNQRCFLMFSLLQYFVIILAEVCIRTLHRSSKTGPRTFRFFVCG